MVDPVSKIATSLAAEAGKEIAAPVSRGIGQTVNDMWYCVFGHKWDETRQKKEIEVAYNVEKFKEEITNKSAKIPDENRIEPDIDVIGSTLESAKFRLNKDEIRDMFSNLIVSAMDSSKADDIHPSFSEMIKMLSPLDAQNLFFLFKNQDETISRIKQVRKSGGEHILYNHVYFGNPEESNIDLIEPSIDNLIRLKLVDVHYDRWFTDESHYNKHFNNPFLDGSKKQLSLEKNDLNILKDESIPVVTNRYGQPFTEQQRQDLIEELSNKIYDDIDIDKGMIQLTALGRNFCKVCLSSIAD